MSKKDYKYGETHELLHVEFESIPKVYQLGTRDPPLATVQEERWHIFQQTETGSIIHVQCKAVDVVMKVLVEGTEEWKTTMKQIILSR